MGREVGEGRVGWGENEELVRTGERGQGLGRAVG